jgi:hypothetical protein
MGFGVEFLEKSGFGSKEFFFQFKEKLGYCDVIVLLTCVFCGIYSCEGGVPRSSRSGTGIAYLECY